GRPSATVAQHKSKYSATPAAAPPVEEVHSTRIILDIEGNQREVIDAKDRVVMRYDYDMLGNRIRQASMEAGERWMLNDVTGKPIRAWTSRQHAFETEYDELRRPVRSFVQGGNPADPAEQTFPQRIMFERIVYGDSTATGLNADDRRKANLAGKVYRHYDGAGVVTSERYDFKGNPLRTRRGFAKDHKSPPDWPQNPPPEQEGFSTDSRFDALNRSTATPAPDKSVYRPTYNEANLLDRVDVNLRGARQNDQPVWTSFVANIDYNAKGQRQLIRYANGAQTTYSYDAKTFRLERLNTTRGAGQNGLAATLFADATVVQDLHYTYDPVGNITRIADEALKTFIQEGQSIAATSSYTYDALYRLAAATGREHIGQTAFQAGPPNGDNYRDHPFVGAAHPNDLNALRTYSESYEYDQVGNFARLRHVAKSGNWTRGYEYKETSLIETGDDPDVPRKQSNRLSR